MKLPSEFFEAHVLPKLYESLDVAFPEAGWKQHGDHWEASNREWSKPHFGVRPDRVWCYRNSMYCFQVHGGTQKITWIEYVCGTRNPKGKVYIDAIQKLAAKVGLELPETNAKSNDARRLSLEWSARLKTALHDSPKALAWLRDVRGWSQSVITRFSMGLTVKEQGEPGHRYRSALTFPHVGSDGNSIGHYYTTNIPGVTEFDNPDDSDRGTWGKKPHGEGLFYSGTKEGKKDLLLVEGFKDLFAVCTLIEKNPEEHANLLVVTPTHGASSVLRAPEVRTPDFWMQFDRIYLGLDDDDAGNKAIQKLVPLIPKPSLRPIVPRKFAVTAEKRADWNDLLLRGNLQEFRALLTDAMPPVVSLGATQNDAQCISFEEIDINVAYHNGHLYWPFEMPERIGEGGDVREEYRTYVLRSDGAVLDFIENKRISNRGRAIRRLTDGTPIKAIPVPVRTSESSWSHKSIATFVQACRGKDFTALPTLGELAETVYRHLRASVWLPNRCDYASITLGIITSYCQECFTAVPLFLVQGIQDTGKTMLGKIAAELGCNGRYLGRVTVAALAESCHRFRGLIAVDDFEELAARYKTNDPQISDMVQTVKQSYKKAGGTHTRIGEHGALVDRNLYGVKFFNNTQGADRITLSRMFVIHSQRRTDFTLKEMQKFGADILSREQIRELRNALHSYVYSHVGQISATATEIKRDQVSRDDEIAVPLRVLAKLSGLDYLRSELEEAISRRKLVNSAPDEDTAMHEALQQLVVDGHEYLNAHMLINEMILLLGPSYGANNKSDIPEWQRPHVIGTRMMEWLDQKDHIRKRIDHGNISLRPHFYRIQESKRQLLLAEHAKENTGMPPMIKATRKAGDFCSGCDECRYRNGCVILKIQAPRGTVAAN